MPTPSPAGAPPADAPIAGLLTWLVRQGARLPGTAELDAFTAVVADAWSALGLEVHRDPVPLTGWAATAGTLTVHPAGRGAAAARVPVASVAPCSAATPPEGVRGPVVRAGGGAVHAGTCAARLPWWTSPPVPCRSVCWCGPWPRPRPPGRRPPRS
ncbi:hypothetical protein [Cellulomonas oligotrophica]|uniref:Uncharacterized protein n=1 Tax=Cellulomonas oligotrophica TaxID=931536 RepID=A0A7Y9JWK8_9CELL|nr:hypothetical protein [Cellulomonas oligotrophica]NYD85773.1 hypothetical protein [Cellulomonas oligotrophica]GIG31221.1 hypothetical protein Col01nite_03800 [Cellulomonas oligotrophica]